MATPNLNEKVGAMLAPPQPPGATDWRVKDRNARGGVRRTHEPVLGVVYDLSATEWTAMPEGHARKFLRDESFEVIDAAGLPVFTLPDESKTGNRALNLPAGLIVARVEELTKEAILARVAQIPGGEAFNNNSGKERLVEFLIGHQSRGLAEAVPDSGRDLGDGTEQMSDEQAKRLLEFD